MLGVLVSVCLKAKNNEKIKNKGKIKNEKKIKRR